MTARATLYDDGLDAQASIIKQLSGYVGCIGLDWANSDGNFTRQERPVRAL